MSHLNDPSLQPRKLDATENIFEIIMPWLPEYKEEEDKLHKEKISLGLTKDNTKKEKVDKNKKK
jgi:hypothetical protein